MSSEPIPRMRAEDRRELVLDAAMAVFGETGYVGTTTDRVAKAAGVSQPYVVRMFGTKEKLFLEVLHRALDCLLTAFRAALADESGGSVQYRLGIAYVALAEQTGLLLSLMHGFVLGADPQIGAAARRGFLEVYNFLRNDAGLTADEAQRFLADGMLVNTMIGIRMSDEYHDDPAARELLDHALEGKVDLMLGLAEKRS
jgi:TetR/AcrR family transcriptional regulator